MIRGAVYEVYREMGCGFLEAVYQECMLNELILFCGCCRSDIIADETKQRVRTSLQKSGIAYKDYPELCELAAQKDQELQNELVAASSVTIIACFPRAVKWILNAGSASVAEKDVRYFNMREQSAEEIIRALGCDIPATVDEENTKIIGLTSSLTPSSSGDNGWVPWFPVIDYDRCINCGQCLDFCLFGVYERDEENKVVVAQPANCKNNCPACARICPKVAIIFPKLTEAPINGAEVSDVDLSKAKVAIDIDEIVGDDLYNALAARQKRARRALLKRKGEVKALEERGKCKQKSEDGSRKPEGGGQRSEVGGQRSEVGGLEMDGNGNVSASSEGRLSVDEIESLSDEELLKVACEACSVDCGENPQIAKQKTACSESAPYRK